MLIKLGELKNAENALKNLAELKLEYDIEVDVCLTNIFESVAKEFEKMEKFKNKLIEKFGDEIEKDGQKIKQITTESSKWDKFVKNYNKLMNMEINLDVTQLDKSILTGSKISKQDLKSLEKFFTDYKPLKIVEDTSEYDIVIEE